MPDVDLAAASSPRETPRAATPPCRLPAPGACDAHAHVFAAEAHFPLRVATSYAPPDAPAPAHRAMLRTTGMQRGVLVQAAVYGDDNAALVDALAQGDGAIVGVGSLSAEAADVEFERLHAAGVRGLRFVEARDPTGARYRGTVGFDALEALAPRMRSLGWHAELWAPADRVVADGPMLRALDLPIVLGHMGGLQAARGLDDPGVRGVARLLADDGFWLKLTICRASQAYPDFADLRAIHDRLVGARPDRLVWGSDWPHVRMAANAPDPGRLLDILDTWIAGDEGLRTAILADNPAALYGFRPAV